MTEVFLFDRGEEPLPDAAARLLPPWRRERWERLRHPAARQDSLSAGLLYVFAMGRAGVPADATVTLLPSGKPLLAGRDEVFFSLSHSGRYAMCAVSPRPIGADVQLMRAIRPTLARRFHPRERDWLSERPEEEQTEAFFRLWTRKEAWVKAEGASLSLSLAQTDVIHRVPGRFFRDYALPDGFCAAVCACTDDIPAEPAVVSRGELLTGSL